MWSKLANGDMFDYSTQKFKLLGAELFIEEIVGVGVCYQGYESILSRHRGDLGTG